MLEIYRGMLPINKSLSIAVFARPKPMESQNLPMPPDGYYSVGLSHKAFANQSVVSHQVLELPLLSPNSIMVCQIQSKGGVSHIVSLDPLSRGHLDVVSTTWFLHLRERCFLVLCTLTRCRSTPRMERVDDSKATSPSLEGHEDLHSELSRYKGIKTQSLKALKL